MERATPILLGVAVFLWFSLLTPPSVYWLDSGELTAAASGLGVAHPTGFPLYTFLGFLASLIPIGEIAWRVALLSGLCAGVTTFFLARTVLLYERGLVGVAAACAAAALLAVSSLFLRHGTIAEVYAPTAACLAATVYVLARLCDGWSARLGLAFAALMGVGLALHGSYRLLLIVPAVVVLVRCLRDGDRWPLVAPALTLGVAAAAHLYLPLRAGATDPVLDWGHTAAIGPFFDHIRAQSIVSSFRNEMFATEGIRVGAAMREWATTIFEAVGPVCLVLAMVGAVALFRRAQPRWRWLGAALVLWLVVDTFYAVSVNPMGLVDWQNGVPTVVVLALLAAIGIVAAARAASAAALGIAVCAGSLMLLPPMLLGVGDVAVASRGDGPMTWAEAALDQGSPRATLFVTGDSIAAPLLYAQSSAGARPDAVVLVRQLARDVERTAQTWKRAGRGELAHGGIAKIFDRYPLLWEPGGDLPPPTHQVVADAPLHRLERQPKENGVTTVAGAVSKLRRLFATRDSVDVIARRVQAQALIQLAISLLRQGTELDMADGILAAALALDPRSARGWVNRGVVAARRRKLEDAVRYTEAAVSASPSHVGARINLARYLLALDRAEGALVHARAAMELAPKNASGFALASAASLRSGDRARAAELAATARTLDSQNRDVLALPKGL